MRDTQVMQPRSERNAVIRDADGFRTLADNLPQLVWMSDSSGAVVWLNRRWFEYTGAATESSLGGGWLELVHPEHSARVLNTFHRAIADGGDWEDTFPLRGADGAYRWFLSRAIAVRGHSGAVVRWYGTSTDVTARVAVEEELRHTARRTDTLLAWLGHELRNPLTPILTAAHLLTLLAPGDPRVQTAKDTITRQTMQLANLVDNLLDTGRIALGKLRLRTSQAELTALVTQAVEACQADISRRHHRLHLSLPQRPFVLEADGTRIVQLISNLLNNAAKYMHDGGVIRLAIDVDGKGIAIRVRDEGIGIAADVLPRVFDPYVQAGTGPLHAQGFGIGLALVKAIAEAHGGTVEARSDGRDRGSEFIVRLPLANPAAFDRDSHVDG
jgi:PAS domain S-box-containing protein